MLIIARDDDASHHIRRTLEENPPHPQARCFDFAIDHQGLAVTVL